MPENLTRMIRTPKLFYILIDWLFHVNQKGNEMTDAIAKTGTTVENDVMNFEKMTFAQNANYGKNV